jgi:hypothetical protein
MLDSMCNYFYQIFIRPVSEWDDYFLREIFAEFGIASLVKSSAAQL